MTASTVSPTLPGPWNWPRVGALSGTLSLHFVALLMLLVPPAAVRLLRMPAPVEPVFVRVIEPPKAEPDPPQPRPIVHEVRPKPHVAPPTPAPTPPALPPQESSMPEPPTAPPAPPGPATPAPVEVAPTALAYLTRSRVPYPHDAARARQQGTVVLRVLVGPDGVPRSVEIETSSGFRSLDLAAREAVGHWTFSPGTRNGVPTTLWARVPIAFRIDTL
jgi:protein TonB